MIINNISGMGGGQRYCQLRVRMLKSKGYQVQVISAFAGEVLLADIKEYEQNVIPELKYTPACYTSAKADRIFNRLDKMIGECDQETIIESSTVSYAEWAEMIARKYHCRHVGNFLDEEFRLTSQDARFLKFKYDRNELFGTSPKTMSLLFKDFYPMPDNDSHTFKPFMGSIVEDVPYKIRWSRNGAVNIGCFSRLDKPCVIPALKQITPFLKKYSQKEYNIILIGGPSTTEIEKSVHDIFSSFTNVKVYITGYLTPLPRVIGQSLDVCIATAGCANVIADEDVPTLYVNAVNGEMAGILKYTIDSRSQDLRYADHAEISMYEALEQILFHDYCNTHAKLYNYFYPEDYDAVGKRALESELQSVRCVRIKKYYNISSIKPEGKKQRTIKLITMVCGIKAMDYLMFTVWPKLKKHNH